MSNPTLPSDVISSAASIVSAAAALVTVLLLYISLGIAKRQINRSAQSQKCATASQLWQAYLSLAFANPVFAFPKKFLGRYKFLLKTIDDSAERYESYEWFVSQLLHAADEILRAYPPGHHLRDLALLNVSYRKKYLRYRAEEENQDDYAKVVSLELKAFMKGLVEAELRAEKLLEFPRRDGSGMPSETSNPRASAGSPS